MSFPIVGIGASRAALSATSELLKHLGATPGVAVVVVHADFGHESNLVEPLSRAAQMPVRVSDAEQRIEPNHVYVMPPSARLSLLQGPLRLIHCNERSRLPPIDFFLESLANQHETQTIGVLFPGTGADGARGLCALRAAGGVTFAHGDGAECRALPESVELTRFADAVLPPSAIAHEIRRMAAQVALPTTDEQLEFAQLLDILSKHCRTDLRCYKPGSLRRRAQRRQSRLRLETWSEYLDLLARDPAELEALGNDILIHVTSFFRDPVAFELIKPAVFAKLLEARAGTGAIRIWVPGCSSGEEVYSLAIALLEFLSDAGARDLPIQLFGTDLSSLAIDKARAAKYPLDIERDVSAARLQRFFSKSGETYQIRKDVRDRCVFAQHDITRDAPFSRIDVVSCRNLMIYFGAALQDRILPLFHYALRPPGFLLLGTAETTRDYPGFQCIDHDHKIYARRPSAAELRFDFAKARSAEPQTLADSSRRASQSAFDVVREADRLVLAQFSPAGVIVSDDLTVVQFRGAVGSYLELSPGPAGLDLMRMLREDLRLPVQRALERARSTQEKAHGEDPSMPVEAIPLQNGSPSRFFLILFERLTARAAGPPGVHEPDSPLNPEVGSCDLLGQALASTKSYLESVVEQLEGKNQNLREANEEVLSSNEELRSTNEELQIAQEELQASNEELRTLNDEMIVRNAESARLNDDLSNVLGSVAIPIVILDRQSRIRRFTGPAARLFRLVASDVGRPIGDIRARLQIPDLPQILADVLAHLCAAEHTVQDDAGRWYQFVVRPYLTTDNQVDGTTLLAFDIDVLKKTQQELVSARVYAESVIDTVRECLLVIDRKLCIRSANRAFYRTFHLTPEQAEGQPFQLPSLRNDGASSLANRFSALAEGASFEDVRETLELANEDERTFSVSGRHIDGTPWFLLALDDISQQVEAERVMQDSQERLQQMAFERAVAEERERRRIAGDLHDRIGQALALTQIKLTGLRGELTGASRATIDDAVRLLAQSLLDTRTLTFELSPPVLYDLGLKEALAWLAEQIETEHGVRVEVRDDGLGAPLEETAMALVFRAVRELLVNVVKHAQSTRAKVTLSRFRDHFEVSVEDFGVGFDPEPCTAAARGYGLFSVREQIGPLGGTVLIDSAPRKGTRVRLRIPLRHGAPAGLTSPETGP